MDASSRVDVTAQGITQGDPETESTTDDLLPLSDDDDISKPALGGGGGDGGDGGDATNHTEVTRGPGIDGVDGNSGNATGGKGGKAGAAGEASASGTALCIDALNPDGQRLLEYSFIHNNIGDISVTAGGGGAGGGGGGAGIFVIPPVPPFFAGTFFPRPGASGANGAPGASASAQLVSTQTSGVNVTATMGIDPLLAAGGHGAHFPQWSEAEIHVEFGWISGASDWVNEGAGSVWQRAINMSVSAGSVAFVVINGNPNGSPTAYGIDSAGAPFYKNGTDLMSSDSGSFAVGPGELGYIIVNVGDTATIIAGQAGIASSLRGSMTTGAGGAGGGGGAGNSTNGGGGGGGASYGNGNGGDGGAGGAGGTRADLRVGDGGGGGEGGDGGERGAHKDGFFSGTADVYLSSVFIDPDGP